MPFLDLSRSTLFFRYFIRAVESGSRKDKRESLFPISISLFDPMQHKRTASSDIPRGSQPTVQKKARGVGHHGSVPPDDFEGHNDVPLLLRPIVQAKKSTARWKPVEKDALQSAILAHGIGDNKVLADALRKKGVDRNFEQVRWKLGKQDMRAWIKEYASRIPGLDTAPALQALQKHHAANCADADDDDDDGDDDAEVRDGGDDDDDDGNISRAPPSPSRPVLMAISPPFCFILFLILSFHLFSLLAPCSFLL
jgi:hypothetical protein